MLQVPDPRVGVLHCRGRDLVYGERTLVMGIVNLTPDSFSGDGLGSSADPVAAALDQAQRMVAEGADLIDVGGESTRPGSRPIEVAAEVARVVPVIEALAAAIEVPISIDTRRAAVAEAALRAGAGLVNDVTGLRRDPDLAGVAAAFRAPVIVMHSPGESWEVAWPVSYDDVIAQVLRELEESITRAVQRGVERDQIVVDPGFGFGKGDRDNLTLLRHLGELRRLGQPILLGTSRKRTIGRVLGGLEVDDRLEGSLATLSLAVAQGVDMVRVHDVRPSVRTVRLADAVVR